jgi:hypothetical protein
MFVKPAPGLKIRDPDMKDFLPEEGRDVPDDHLYWVKRLGDKDVELAQRPAPQVEAEVREAENAEADAVDDAPAHHDGSA